MPRNWYEHLLDIDEDGQQPGPIVVTPARDPWPAIMYWLDMVGVVAVVAWALWMVWQAGGAIGVFQLVVAAVGVVILLGAAGDLRWSAAFTNRGSVQLQDSTVRVFIGRECVLEFDTHQVALLRAQRRSRGYPLVGHRWYWVELVNDQEGDGNWLWASSSRPVGPFDALLETVRRDSRLERLTPALFSGLCGVETWIAPSRLPGVFKH